MRFARTFSFLAALAILLPVLAQAQVVQTITIDGVNDFDPANLVEDDGGDTQYTQIDIGEIYITNDANNLYLGFEQDHTGWGSVQLGVAIDVNTASGGTTDPWSRQLEWSGAATRPDYMFYINIDSNWQASYQINPGPGTWTPILAGPGALGVPLDTGFREYAFLLSSLGLDTDDIVNVEVWTTQDSATRGPLDAGANDAVQTSTPGGTVFDLDDPVAMTLFHSFTILDATDNVAPVVEIVGMDADDGVFVRFSEAVDAATAEIAGNYSLPGATITSATVDGAQPDLVHLGLSADLPISADLYTVTVTNVTDLAGNPIGTPNSADFLWKNVTFLGHMSRYLDANSTPPDGFSVEGGAWPLTWDLCDNADMADLGGGDYQWNANFWAPGDGEGGASTSFEWKFVHNCTTYEPMPGNRVHTLTMDGSDSDLIDVWWNDEDPSNFTLHDIDVLFYVDMNEFMPAAGDTVAIAGNVAPLDQEWPPAVIMVDDGSGIDETAGDGIYSLVVRFPADSQKNVTYKFRWNGEYECFGQDDRNVFLNDELFDTVGGTLGPIELPTYHFDACWVSWRPVEVVFQYNIGVTSPALDDHVVSVNGTRSNEEPPAFSWDVPSLNVMHDDGQYPDEDAGDLLFAISVVFPDSSNLFTEYKYLVDDVYEPLVGNREFWLDPDNFDAVGNPQILEMDGWPVGIEDLPSSLLTGLANVPNPFNPSTEIKFTVHRAGEGSLRVFDAQGRVVKTLHAGNFIAGSQSFTWNGQDEAGRQMASGVYLYRLEIDGSVGMRKMMLIK